MKCVPPHSICWGVHSLSADVINRWFLELKTNLSFIDASSDYWWADDLGLYKIFMSRLLKHFCGQLKMAALSELVIRHQKSYICYYYYYYIFNRNWVFVFFPENKQTKSHLLNPIVSPFSESCQNWVVIALYYKLSHLPDMRWLGFACFLSLLSHLGVRSHRISQLSVSSLYQYCQINGSPEQVGTRGILVGQQAFSGKFRMDVCCKGHSDFTRSSLGIYPLQGEALAVQS